MGKYFRVRRAPNVPVELADNLVVTTAVKKQLKSKAMSEIPETVAVKLGGLIEDFVFPMFWLPGIIIIWKSDEFSLTLGIVIFFLYFVFPYTIYKIMSHILAVPRAERIEKIDKKILDLAWERKKRIEERDQFYSSPEWVIIRGQIIEKEGNICALCGVKIRKKADITVDHIKPRSANLDLALDKNNLRVLCRRCNSQKGNRE